MIQKTTPNSNINLKLFSGDRPGLGLGHPEKTCNLLGNSVLFFESKCQAKNDQKHILFLITSEMILSDPRHQKSITEWSDMIGNGLKYIYVDLSR